jgi:hypothetical protein
MMMKVEVPPAGDRIKQLLDYWEIQQLWVRYFDRVDADDAENAVADFAPNARVEIMTGKVYDGREAYARALGRVLAQYAVTSHHVSNFEIHVERNTAHMTAYVYAYHRLRETGEPWQPVGADRRSARATQRLGLDGRRTHPARGRLAPALGEDRRRLVSRSPGSSGARGSGGMTHEERIGLLRGTGPGLGAYALKYPREERSLLRVLRDQAEERPDAPWLTFDFADTLTFAEAYRRANRVGNALRDEVGAGAHVALFLRNQIDFMPAFYGAMANGGVAVPLNPDARGPLLRHVVEKSRAKVIISRADLLDVLERLEDLCEVQLVVAVGEEDHPEHIHGVPVIAIGDWLSDFPDTPPQDIPAHHEMALLQFTSGTTGHQKGAIYSHHWLHLFAAMITDSSERTPDDVLMTPLPLCHVAALHLIANSALHAGCHAHMLRPLLRERVLEPGGGDRRELGDHPRTHGRDGPQGRTRGAAAQPQTPLLRAAAARA